MIDDSLIESAKIIRLEFKRMSSTLERYEDDVNKIAQYFMKTSNELIEISKDKKNSILDMKEKVMSRLNDLEIESNKICEKIDQISTNMEKLRAEEKKLYEVIKKRYPSLSDDEIKIEIQRRIDN